MKRAIGIITAVSMRLKYHRETGDNGTIINAYVMKYLYFICKDVTLAECPHETAAKRQSSELSQCKKQHQWNITLLRTV